MKNSDT